MEESEQNRQVFSQLKLWLFGLRCNGSQKKSSYIECKTAEISLQQAFLFSY
jgi:hypothetical protein